MPEATIAQRVVRAKRALTAARVPFELPAADALTGRLVSVLEVIYLVFNEGYCATSGGDWMRPALCDEALRLGRVMMTLMPQQDEVQGLAALMEIQASRTATRTDAHGQPVLLLDQDRRRWDALLIGRGLAALKRAQALASIDGPGPYTLQAAIAACHARATTAEATDWPLIVTLYEALARRTPSPVIELNRAVAVGMAYGPDKALVIVDALMNEPALARYHLLPAVRADLLAKLARCDEARVEFERAASMTSNDRERAVLMSRAQAMAAT